MFRNYIKIAARNIWKHKSFSLINTFGLALSMSVCILIIMLVADQKSIDRHNVKSTSIYRVTTTDLDDSGPFDTYATAPLPLLEKYTSQYPGITRATRIRGGFGNNWIGIGQDVNIPVAGFYVDPQFLSLFNYDLESGSPIDVLSKPNSIVLKKETAEKLFGQSDPVGKVITVGESGDYIVTGVLKEQKGKSHIQFDALASLSSLVQLEKDSILARTLNNWRDIHHGYIYFEKDPDVTEGQLIANFESIDEEMYEGEIDRNLAFGLQPLLSITPGPLMANEIGPTLPMVFVYFMAGLAFIVMISAAFNYMNLSIARALTRAKEVGIRKVSGATRRQLIFQFLSEAIILSLLALVISQLMLVLLKPAFESLNFSRFLHWELSENYMVYLLMVGFAILVGVVSGLFPALVLSSFQPIQVLKGLTGIRLLSGMGIKKLLIVAQFGLSLIFIISVSLVSDQLSFMLDADFGFNKKRIVNVPLNQVDYVAFKSALVQETSIEAVTGGDYMPGAGTMRSDDLWKNPSDSESITTSTFSVDDEYINIFGLELLSGSNFKQLGAGSNEVIINEQAVTAFGFESPAEAVGEIIYDTDTTTELRIAGVVKDYHHLMLMMEINPMILRYNPDNIQMAHLKVSSGRTDAWLEPASRIYADISGDKKISYQYLDAELGDYYELLFGDIVHIVGLTSFLALTIACLGLLGLTTYTVETRKKEVSIRKVLGASSSQLIFQLSKSFLALLVVAIILSVPVAYFLNNSWLELIAYRTPISAGVILFGISVLTIFGVGTIVTQTFQAGQVSPAETLRNQ